MCEKHQGKCFVLRSLHRLPSHLSFFFSMTVFKREIISHPVLTWLKTITDFFAQYQKCSKYFSSFTGW